MAWENTFAYIYTGITYDLWQTIHIFHQFLNTVLTFFSGVCLYLHKGVSRVHHYECHHFLYGCHNSSFPSNKIFERKCKELPWKISSRQGCGNPFCKKTPQKTKNKNPQKTEQKTKAHAFWESFKVR